MLKCEYCSHECTAVDFVTLRNVCEHLYLDSMANKSQVFWPSKSGSMFSGTGFQPLLQRGTKQVADVECAELSLLEK